MTINIDEYRSWLEDKIQTIGTELEKYINARNALLEAEQEREPIVQKATNYAPKAKREVRKGGEKAAAIRDRVVNAIETLPWPVASKQIVSAVYPDQKPTPQQEKRVHNALWDLNKRGLIKRVDVGQYAAVNHD